MPLYPLLFALALGQNPAPGQDGSPLSVQVGLFAYRADGSTMASATTGGVLGPFDGNVFASTPCNVGSVPKEPPAGARNAWRINGQVIEVSRDSAVVQLDWQRTKQSGDPANGPTGSERLTLQSGTPVTLDSVWADATGSCDIVRIALEARLAPRPVGRLGAVGFGAQPGSGAGGAGARVGTGSGSGSGAGAGSGGRARVVAASSDSIYDVELWLVHQPATGDERVVHAKPRFKGDWFQFTFLPLRIDTPRGTLEVEVGGALTVTTGTAGDRQLTFSTKRSVVFRQAGSDGNDVRKAEASGGGETTMAMPGPAEVLSFEMPPLQNPTGGPLLPDRVSVRLRIKPVQ